MARKKTVKEPPSEAQMIVRLISDASICPFCGFDSKDTDGLCLTEQGGFHTGLPSLQDDGDVHIYVRCPVCKTSWKEKYDLVRFIEIKPGKIPK